MLILTLSILETMHHILERTEMRTLLQIVLLIYTELVGITGVLIPLQCLDRVERRPRIIRGFHISGSSEHASAFYA
jgi:hypothetical protein